VDASHYEILPDAVFYPKDLYDLQKVCKYSHAKKVPITPRGAGTGLLGQSLSGGIIVDFTKHMNKIVEIEEDHVVVQPGVIKGMLDRELKKRNKFLPPDPASSNFCTIGGMIADNSSGVHCLAYGSTIDFLVGIDAVYADGEAGFARADRFDSKSERLEKLLSPHLDLIKNGYPKVSKNSCGYRLDAVMSDKFMPHKVFAASEGTLGLVTSAELRILDTPVYRCMVVFGFEDLLTAILAVPHVLKFSPVALEILDHTVLPAGRTENTGCLMFVEFAGNNTRIEDRLTTCIEELAGRCSVIEYASDEQSMANIWRARKGALNEVMKLAVGSRKPIGLIEDTVVPPQLLSDHAANLLKIYRENKLEYVMYGHAGNGNLHTRPLVDTNSAEDADLVQRIAGTVFRQVISAGGTITGEHGDGIARVGFIEMMYGKKIAGLFSLVKRVFDPKFLMNPGKKVPCKSTSQRKADVE